MSKAVLANGIPMSGSGLGWLGAALLAHSRFFWALTPSVQAGLSTGPDQVSKQRPKIGILSTAVHPMTDLE